MAYRLQPQERVETGLRRIAREQILRARDELREPGHGADEAIHDARKRFKKVRGVLRLVRPRLGASYRRLNITFRDLGRELAGFRDADAMVETFAKLRRRFPGEITERRYPSDRFRMVLTNVAFAQPGVDRQQTLRRVADRLENILPAVDDWPIPVGRDFSTVDEGFLKTYKRGRIAMTVAYDHPSPERFHDWRKRVKYHWYHVRLLQNVWPKMMKARRDAMKQLSDRLGDNHDLDVLWAAFSDHGDELFDDATARDDMQDAIRRRQDELQHDARQIGRHVYSEKPKLFHKRLADQWAAWQKEIAEES